MRLLAIGYPLPNVNIDNYNVLTAPSYFDYDALFIDPASVTRVVRELLENEHEFEAFDGRPVINGPTSAAAISAADQVRRRGEEAQRLLERGGVIVVMARPNAVQAGLVGFEGCDRYSWLPAPAGAAWGVPLLRQAEGKTVRIADELHPFARVLREQRANIRYRAAFDDRQAAVRQAKIIATTGADVPIGVEFAVAGGRVVFVPAFGDDSGSFRSELADQLVDGISQMLGTSVSESAPYWARSLAVPGLEQVEAEIEEAEAAARESSERVETARARQDELAGHRRLVTDEGGTLAEAVRDALGLFGIAVTSKPGEAMVAEAEDLAALVETEGSREEVVEWPYVRLQRRLEDQLLKFGKQYRGIVVANGKRFSEPAYREREFADTLRIACENYGYCLVTGETLFTLVQRALGGAEDAMLTGIRRRLFSTKGLLTAELALGEVEEEKDTGPIF
ncbi:MAG: hypothetical protein IT303_00705 [Dehalococcoidia bacterium]|nr:hypothetical protein [Dehalococcoidia bacterium]